MSELLTLAFVVQIVRISVPYVLAALGGTFSERGGVTNIALEGILLASAFLFVLGSYLGGHAAVGLVCGLAGGVGTAALLGAMAVTWRADPIVSGVAINLLALGGTKFFLKLVWDSSSNSSRVAAIEPLARGEGDLGALLELATHPLIVATALLVGGSTLLLFRTRFGLRLRACGEHPAAAASLGIAVRRIRWTGVLLSGLLGGLGGVWLASNQHQFTDNMSNGRGYIALAAVIFGRWHPAYAALACLLFGTAEAVQILLQGQGHGVPTQLLQALPYLLTIVTVVGFMGRARPPAALGKPFEG
ncbi:MAG: ABC transporter permease [Myxococcota bacterium]|jgi:simple sugar transport system permease protein|nr:ABC transporter permease [Myxococcota bacterium]